jgi:hypothetical protein
MEDGTTQDAFGTGKPENPLKIVAYHGLIHPQPNQIPVDEMKRGEAAEAFFKHS